MGNIIEFQNSQYRIAKQIMGCVNHAEKVRHMQIRKYVFVICLIALVACSRGKILPTTETTPVFIVSDAQLIAESSKHEYAIGEPIVITLKFKNESGRSIGFLDLSNEELRHYATSAYSLQAEIRKPSGIIMTIERYLTKTMIFWPKQDYFTQLDSGQEIDINIDFSGDGASFWSVEPSFVERLTGVYIPREHILEECFSDVGEYTVQFTFETDLNEYWDGTNDVGGHFSKKTIDSAWTGKISSNKLNIRIKPVEVPWGSGKDSFTRYI